MSWDHLHLILGIFKSPKKIIQDLHLAVCGLPDLFIYVRERRIHEWSDERWTLFCFGRNFCNKRVDSGDIVDFDRSCQAEHKSSVKNTEDEDKTKLD